MARMSTLVVSLVSMLVLLGGCVSQGQHDGLLTQNRRLQEQIVELRDELDSKNAELEALRNAPPATDPAAAALMQKLREDRDNLAAALSEAEAQLRNAGGLQIGGTLPADLDNALKALAAANPGLMEYDAKRGMIKFRSDLTFALGSTQISDQGVAALGQLASIITSPAAAKYGVRVVGHTDNVPVANPANKQRFGDNWGLSAFRAISVKNVFQQAGVSPTRIEIAGRGEYQPVVANGANGAEANRRVEIFLVRMEGSGLADAAAPGVPATAEAPEPEAPEQFK